MQSDTDHGPKPFVTNIETATVENANYRTTLWTGKNIQLTLMSIEPGADIGLEVHPDHDQFLRLEDGQAMVYTGPDKETLTTHQANKDDAVFIPAGTWHNLVNNGQTALKAYSIYGPPQHPHGAVHPTKADAEAAEQQEA